MLPTSPNDQSDSVSRLSDILALLKFQSCPSGVVSYRGAVSFGPWQEGEGVTRSLSVNKMHALKCQWKQNGSY